jgi:predicted MPP superfamily phosphohydrolase
MNQDNINKHLLELQYKINTIPLNYNKIFLLSDLHFGVRSNSIEWLDNHLDFFYNYYIPYLKKHKQESDILFILGDWYDNRQLLDINILNKSIQIVTELAFILPIHMMTGNHDIYKKNNTDVNSLITFKNIPNVTIYEEPIVLTNNNNTILLLPWIGNYEKEEQYAKYNKADYVFAHTDLRGFRYDNDLEIQNGSELKKISGAKKVFSGHIHKRQENRGSIYIGSPYSTKRSDIGNRKGVYVFLPNENKYEFTENKHSPIFQRILLDNLLNLTLEQTHALLNNSYTDIIVPDKYVHLFNLTKFIDLLTGCNYKKIEARGEKIKLDELINLEENSDTITDIISLLEYNITNLEHTAEVILKLNSLNKEYYNKAKSSQLHIELI